MKSIVIHAAAGWTVTVIDGAGSIQGRAAAFGQALALQPDGMINNGFNAVEQQAALQQACDADIPMVAWHAGGGNGPDEEACLFVNVTTDPMEVSRAAAQWAFVDAEGEPGVVIFTDSTYAIAVTTADEMQRTIEELGGTAGICRHADRRHLQPHADADHRAPAAPWRAVDPQPGDQRHLLRLHGSEARLGGHRVRFQPEGRGRGRRLGESAYQRIRANRFQAVTVAEPLNLQGWQLVDELNRAMQDADWSGYATPLHVVTQENVECDGGQNNTFDPDNGYRDAYRQIWGVTGG